MLFLQSGNFSVPKNRSVIAVYKRCNGRKWKYHVGRLPVYATSLYGSDGNINQRYLRADVQAEIHYTTRPLTARTMPSKSSRRCVPHNPTTANSASLYCSIFSIEFERSVSALIIICCVEDKPSTSSEKARSHSSLLTSPAVAERERVRGSRMYKVNLR